MKNFLRYALCILGPCAVLQPLGMDIFVSGLPFMIDSLRVTEQKIQFLLISFVLASSVPQLIMGKLADLYGRRPIILIAALSFSLTSYLCTTTHNIYWLTLLRFFQGLTAGTSLVVVYAIIRDLYHGNESSKMYSYISCILALTAMFAPLLGATLINYIHTWESTFHFLTLFAGLSFIIALIALPETLTSTKQPQTDILPSSNAFKTILTTHTFWTYSICATMVMTGLFLYFSIGSIILMKHLNISSYTFSLLFGLNACFYLSGSYLSSRLLNQFEMKSIVLFGNLFVLIGTSAMLLSNYFMGLNVFYIVLSNSLITLGGGLVMGPATGAALNPFEEYSGTASGMFGAIQYGLPAFISLLVTRFEMTSTLPLAIPILTLSLINFYLLKRTNTNTTSQERLKAEACSPR